MLQEHFTLDFYEICSKKGNNIWIVQPDMQSMGPTYWVGSSFLSIMLWLFALDRQFTFILQKSVGQAYSSTLPKNHLAVARLEIPVYLQLL